MGEAGDRVQLFISHSSHDNGLALRVQGSLRAIGYESIFLDVDAHGGIHAGEEWRNALFNGIAECSAVVYLGTAAAARSRWCHTELALARWLRKPIVPLAFGPTSPHEVIADLHAVTVSEDGVDTVLATAMTALGLRATTAWDRTRSPYPGLRSFREDEAAVFVGREESIRELGLLVDPPARPSHGMVVPVLGPSGSGKSSLVRAGLVPKLRQDASWVVFDPWTPRDTPFDELAQALHRCAARLDLDVDADECRRLAAAERGLVKFLQRVRSSRPAEAPEPRLLLTIDQGEELVTTTSARRRREFLDWLAANCEPPSPVVVLVTARTDMWDEIDAPPLDAFTSSTVLHVAPLGRPDLVRVIEEPAKSAGIEFESGLVERLVDDTGSGSALPFLAFVLNELCSSTDRVGGRLILTHAGYDATGGVQGGIAHQARAVVGPSRAESDMAASVLPLVSLTGAKPTSRRATAADLTEGQRADLDRLAGARLVVVDGEGPECTYAVTHEALLSAWDPLADLIDARREDLRLRDRLLRQASDWREGGGGRSGLLDGAALAAAVDWSHRSVDLVTPGTRAFVQESEQQARRRRHIRLGALAVFGVLAAALVVILVRNERDANDRALDARARELIAIGQRASVADPVAAAIALAEAYDLRPSVAGFADSATALLNAPARDAWSAQDPIGVLGFDAGDASGVSVGPAGAKVWDLANGDLLHEVPGVTEAAIRPDGRVVAATRAGPRVDLLDVGRDLAEPAELATITGARAAFSEDGSLMAVLVGHGMGIALWDVSDPTSPVQHVAWGAGPSAVHHIAFGTDGRILTLSSDRALRVWDQRGVHVATIEEVLTTAVEPSAPVTGYLGTDTTGSRVYVSGTGVGEVATVVDLDRGAITRRLGRTGSGDPTQQINPVWSSAFDRDGTTWVAFDISQNGEVLDTTSGEVVTRLDGHEGLAMRTVVTDASTVISAGLDGTIRVWDARPAEAPAAPSELRTALCEQFGRRMDSGRLSDVPGIDIGELPCSVDDDTTAEADLLLPGAASRVDLPTTPELVLQDSFVSPGQWAVTTNSDNQGEQRYSVVDDAYQIALDLSVDGWTYWSPMPTPMPSVGDTYRVGATVRLETGAGRCGVGVGAGDSAIALALIDPASGAVALTVFHAGDGSQLVAQELGRLPATLGPSSEVELVVEDTVATVLVDGEPVGALRHDLFAEPTSLYLAATGGVVTCAFDDLIVRTA